MAATDTAGVSPLGGLLAKHVAPSTELVALLFVDPTLGASTAFMPKWESLWKDVCGIRADTPTDGGADGARLKTVLVVEEPGSKDMSTTALHSHWAVEARVMDIRKAARLSFVQTFPELVLVSPSGDVISTDGVQALRRGSFQPSAFPSGWRTNILTAVVAPGPTDSSGALVHPDTALQLGVYPGDTALVRSAIGGAGSSACLFVNAPEPEHELCGAEGSAGPSTCTPGTITLAPLVAANAGVTSGDAVAVEPFLSVPDATSITLTPLQAASAPALLHPLHAYFGLAAPAPASGSADVPGEGLALAESVQAALEDHAMATEEGSAALASLLAQGGDSWLVKYASTAQCFRRPVASGQVLAVPLVGQGDVPVGAVLPGLVSAASPARTAFLQAAAASVDTANAGSGAGGSSPSGQPGLAFAGDQLVEEGVRWAAFLVTATVPRGTVVVAPTTTLSLA